MTRISQSVLKTEGSERGTGARKNASAPAVSTGGAEDRLDLSPNRNLDLIRANARLLRNELPGLIAQSLLQPSEDQVAQDPLNKILLSLVNPAQNMLQKTAVQEFSKKSLVEFQGEVDQLRFDIPKLTANKLLFPAGSDTGFGSSNGPLNMILNELNGLSDMIRAKVG
ncbi:MAG: hypothetical protein ACE5GQ_04760 [Nitrospinales bacterium]